MLDLNHIDHDNIIDQLAQDSVFADSVPPVPRQVLLQGFSVQSRIGATVDSGFQIGQDQFPVLPVHLF